MAIGHTLLLLTLMADGGIRMTLTDASSAANCEASRASVTRILTDSGKPPLLARCGPRSLSLTPFAHGTPPEAEALRYRVQVPPEGGFSVQLLKAGDPCVAAPDATPAVYCARSAQKPIDRPRP
jgi:hypothetical protein